MAPIRTQNGRMRSAICGTRNSEILATSSADTFGTSAGAAHQLDVVDQHDQRENADEHHQHRARKRRPKYRASVPKKIGMALLITSRSAA